MKNEIIAITDLLRNSLLELTPHLNIRYGTNIGVFETQIETVLYIDKNKAPATFIIKVYENETIGFYDSSVDCNQWKMNISTDEAISYFSAAIELSKIFGKTHFFNAPENDKKSMFCKCGKYLTDEVHYRKQNLK